MRPRVREYTPAEVLARVRGGMPVQITMEYRKKKAWLVRVDTSGAIAFKPWKGKTYVYPTQLTLVTYSLGRVWQVDGRTDPETKVFYLQFKDMKTGKVGVEATKASTALKTALLEATGGVMDPAVTATGVIGMYSVVISTVVQSACTPAQLQGQQNFPRVDAISVHPEGYEDFLREKLNHSPAVSLNSVHPNVESAAEATERYKLARNDRARASPTRSPATTMTVADCIAASRENSASEDQETVTDTEVETSEDEETVPGVKRMKPFEWLDTPTSSLPPLPKPSFQLMLPDLSLALTQALLTEAKDPGEHPTMLVRLIQTHPEAIANVLVNYIPAMRLMHSGQ